MQLLCSFRLFAKLRSFLLQRLLLSVYAQSSPVKILVLFGVLSATALLQHGILSIPPLKTVRPYTVSSAT